MKITIGSDHAGFQAKESIKTELGAMGIACEDVGAYAEDSVDYPDYAAKVAQAVNSGEADRGILVCSSGNGIMIAANKVPGIRAALAWNEETARLARQHNNANIISIGGRTTPAELIIPIVHAYLASEFEGGRHQRRVDKIAAIEQQNC
ncbi:MAG: ribose 5-phosphate isomerase B [Blastocatellia bacterium]